MGFIASIASRPKTIHLTPIPITGLAFFSVHLRTLNVSVEKRQTRGDSLGESRGRLRPNRPLRWAVDPPGILIDLFQNLFIVSIFEIDESYHPSKAGSE
jgi:hypothetical protein